MTCAHISGENVIALLLTARNFLFG